ncbi:AAA family ATPase [Paracraurococcus lichenis]|uniref:AAA family ATPase n=1 Tax=Paracraurococcus lichenis TaxID=3064888 RepID=A0ABT9ECN0_9PROT|nr:AAA family ATPase [Paracraurococcus sp. LOR1-02]MDO9713831.1 AAA family ATPase [Paracraurococcus sp. LOR1-02]
MAWATKLGDIAKRLRSQQIAILAEQNENRREKALRRFTSKEAAALLGITESHLRNRVAGGEGFPEGELSGKNRTFSLVEINAARQWLFDSTGNTKYLTGRRGADGLCVIALTNFKGGVGKSTNSTHLAQYLALRGYRVLLVDLDAQASTTALFGLDPARQIGRGPDSEVLAGGTSIEGWISREPGKEEEAVRNAIRPTYWPNIDLVAGSAVLHRTEDQLKQRQNMTSGPLPEVEFYAEVRAFLKCTGASYDIAILDCRPDINMLSVNAFAAANGLVIPALATNLDLQSMTEFLAFLGGTEQRISKWEGRDWPGWAFVRVLVNRFNAQSRPQVEIVDNLNVVLRELMIRAPMVETSALGSAGNVKWTLYEYVPAKSESGSYRRAVLAMDAVGAAVEAEVLSFWGRKPIEAPAFDVAAE